MNRKLALGWFAVFCLKSKYITRFIVSRDIYANPCSALTAGFGLISALADNNLCHNLSFGGLILPLKLRGLACGNCRILLAGN
jgi:hypothetical protein